MRVNGGSDLARLQMLQKQAFATRNKLDVARAGADLQPQGQPLRGDRRQPDAALRARALARPQRGLHRDDLADRAAARRDAGEPRPHPRPRRRICRSTSSQSVSQGDYRRRRCCTPTTARRAFADTVGILNTQVAGQSLFAGTATDSPALAPADAILADLDALAAGAADRGRRDRGDRRLLRQDAARRLLHQRLHRLGQRPDAGRDRRGPAARLRHARRRTTSSSRCCAPRRWRRWSPAAPSPATRPSRWRCSATPATRLLAAKEGILDLRAERRQPAGDRRARQGRSGSSERETLDLARTKIIATDPLEAASTYQTLQVQLESIYTVTSRLANLRFLNFMR